MRVVIPTAAGIVKPLELPTRTPPANAGGTKWNVGSFDPNGELRNLLPIIYLDLKTPYRGLESLIDSGLQIVPQDYLKGGNFDLATALKPAQKKKHK